jgi:hypothetical protein
MADEQRSNPAVRGTKGTTGPLYINDAILSRHGDPKVILPLMLQDTLSRKIEGATIS